MLGEGAAFKQMRWPDPVSQCVFIAKTVKPAAGLDLVFVNDVDNLAAKKFRLLRRFHLANRRNSPSCCLDVF
jgi:hypothetical protein